ncbi:hypothetical protein NQ176_g7805 [Zarea fungicola]|uniref:Uncharacterized protein n=1 Tax=Zarea fungicola TaxID=93591 RepID=A0ACC1MYA4_9HYPO|nr:hypothetical protein NQ176_g7805 [Lecanicillium fungicola]
MRSLAIYVLLASAVAPFAAAGPVNARRAVVRQAEVEQLNRASDGSRNDKNELSGKKISGLLRGSNTTITRIITPTVPAATRSSATPVPVSTSSDSSPASNIPETRSTRTKPSVSPVPITETKSTTRSSSESPDPASGTQSIPSKDPVRPPVSTSCSLRLKFVTVTVQATGGIPTITKADSASTVTRADTAGCGPGQARESTITITETATNGRTSGSSSKEVRLLHISRTGK